MKFKPMLADTCTDTSKLRYPVLVSRKLDGIRAMVQNGVLVSRNLKPIANKQVQAKFAGLPEGLDGELIVGDPTDEHAFQKTTSIVMAHDKPAEDVNFWVFDLFQDSTVGYRARLMFIADSLNFQLEKTLRVRHKSINSEEELLAYEAEALEEGYEGVMVRDPNGPYKQGRATEKQGWLLKVKRFSDSEAEVTGWYEEMENQNEAKTNALGRTERSSQKANLVGKGTLGGFDVRDLKTGVEFQVGGGFTADQRKQFWKERNELIGKIVKYKHFPVGVKDKPRFPVFIGFRDKADM
jgi:DNA ligase 1